MTKLYVFTQIYDSPESELKLNDVVEFLGVLTFDQNAMMDVDSLDETSDEFSEAESVQMPSGKVPRLHCLIHRKLETQHFLHTSSLLTEASSTITQNKSYFSYLFSVLRCISNFLLLFSSGSPNLPRYSKR